MVICSDQITEIEESSDITSSRDKSTRLDVSSSSFYSGLSDLEESSVVSSLISPSDDSQHDKSQPTFFRFFVYKLSKILDKCSIIYNKNLTKELLKRHRTFSLSWLILYIMPVNFIIWTIIMLQCDSKCQIEWTTRRKYGTKRSFLFIHNS